MDTSILFKASPIDVAGSLQKGAESRTAQIQSEALANEANAQKQDDAAFREYLKVTKNDLATSKGMEQAIKDLQGRISPKSYQGLVSARQKILKSEDDHVRDMASTAEDERKFYVDSINSIMGAFGSEDVDSKDPVAAATHRADVVKRLSAVKTPSGKPQFSQEALMQVAGLSQDEFTKLWNSSKHAKDLLDRAELVAKTKKDQAQASFTEAQAKALAAGKPPTGTENLYDPEGNVYANFPGKGIVNLSTQEHFAGDPSTLKPVPSVKGMKTGAAPVDRNAAALALVDFDKTPPTPVEEKMARQFIVDKMPSLGQNSPLRPRIAALAAKLSLEENIDVAGTRTLAKSEASNVANLTKQYGVIKAGEQTVLNNLELMKPIISKVDASGIPALERWIRAGKRSIAGDADVAQLDALITSTQADIGKVLSATTGAAGVPVAALKKAEMYMGGNLTKEQFDALYDIVPKEMSARTDAMEAQIKSSLNKIASLSAPRSSKDPKVSPKEQADRDKDSEAILRTELAKARQQVRDLKSKGADPASIERAEGDVSAIERELGRKGTKAPAAPPSAIKEGEKSTSKSGKPIIYRNGKWEYL